MGSTRGCLADDGDPLIQSAAISATRPTPQHGYVGLQCDRVNSLITTYRSLACAVSQLSFMESVKDRFAGASGIACNLGMHV